ncbi:MAG: protein-L-isoaspartate(D-aspartate) O-methyltransferase [Myxococcales bacterium]
MDGASLSAELARKGIQDPAALAAIAAVPRELFVPGELRSRAYEDAALPIGEGQTISQPYVVAATCAALRLEPGDKVLDVGTGSGYAAAVLAAMGARVFSIEILPKLFESARERLVRLGIPVQVKLGDGSFGSAAEAPFRGIAVAAATRAVPKALVEQLAAPGRLVLPLGPSWSQRLTRVEKGAEGDLSTHVLLDVAFVPLTSAPMA